MALDAAERETLMPVPGTLSDEDQAKLTAQIMSLVRAAYGEDAQFGLAVAKMVSHEGDSGMALWSFGSTPNPKQLRGLFTLAAAHAPRATHRLLAIEDGNPAGPKQ